MTRHTEQTTSQPTSVPAPILLEDFIEAVTCGVARALAAQEEVSGYQLHAVSPPSLGAGFIVDRRPREVLETKTMASEAGQRIMKVPGSFRYTNRVLG